MQCWKVKVGKINRYLLMCHSNPSLSIIKPYDCRISCSLAKQFTNINDAEKFKVDS